MYDAGVIKIFVGIPLDFLKLTGFEAFRQTTVIFHTHIIQY